jgi:hypothetical protein
MVTYKSGTSVMGRIVDVVSNTVGNARILGQQGSDYGLGLPAVAFEPRLGGWLVSWNATTNDWQFVVRYAALNADGTPRRVKDGLGPAAPRYDLTAVTSAPGLANHSLACSSTTTDFAKCDGLASSYSQLHLAQLFMDDVPPWLGTISVMTDTLMTVDADVPTATFAALTDGQYLAVTGTLTIGGDAGDPTSAVARVEVSEDGGPWQAATGAESWAYNWNVPLADVAHTLRVRATDMVGNVGPATLVTVNLDRTPPAVSFALADNSIVGATRNAAGRWQVAMSGAVNETGVGTHDVATLLTPNGSGWQTATLAGNTWAVNYVLPAFGSDNQALSNPTGVYTFYARATDQLNNQTAPVPLALSVDTTPPVAALNYTGPSSTTITQTLALSGVVTDPRNVAAGVQQLEIAFTPAGQTPGAWANTTLAQSGEGVTTTTWSHPVPAGLEGTYQINLRGTDTRNNRNDDQATWNRWRGEIDTLAPRATITVTYRGNGSAAQTVYQGWAEDMNLTTANFQFPCALQAADRQYYDDTWWNQTTSNTPRLYRLTPACIVNGYQAITPTLHACDRYDHCTTVTGTLPSRTPPLASAVLTPTHESVLTTLNPVSLNVGAYAVNSLRYLTVTVNGTFLNSASWPSGTVTDTVWTTNWTPAGEGRYTLLALASDWAGQVQTSTQPISLTVDTQAPTLTFGYTVLTTTQRVSLGRVVLTGTVTDSVGLEAVQVSTAGGPWDDAAFNDARGEWRYLWYLGAEPDGAAYDVTARASDAANHVTQITQTVRVDLAPPSPVTVTLAYTNGTGVFTTLAPGQTIRDVYTPTAIITWTASSDGVGLGNYLVGWTPNSTSTTGLTSYVSTTNRYHEGWIGEAQPHYAQVIAQDIYGNWQWQTVGPIYADGPRTPDYISDFQYHGWMESGCSQIGADREIARAAPSHSSLKDVQQLYLSWDDESLRFTWVGADWNSDGDLFIYLDTQPGGTTRAYDPYGAGPVITLPAQGGSQLAADYVLWVEDESTARLLTWNGSGWISQTIDSAHWALDTSLRPPHTDLLIPRTWLGSPTSLKLVALASEETALRVWATMPDKNPLNSPRVINPIGLPFAGSSYTLTQQYEWTTLGNGVCPNQGQFAPADLRVSLVASPPGVELGYLEHDLPGVLAPGQYLDANLDGNLDVSLPVDIQPALMGNGQAITYTLIYTNEGALIAPGARVTVTARGGVQLAGGSPQVFALNNVSGTINIPATVNAALDGQSAEVDAVVADAVHGAFDWLWVQHDVDTLPPQGLLIELPVAFVNAYTNTVSGKVDDPSGVPTITLEVRNVGTGSTGDLTCLDPMPLDGQWSCQWNFGGAADGTQFGLRVMAADRFGSASAWTSARRVTVDSAPPSISLSADTLSAFADNLLVPAEVGLSGQVQDDRQAGWAQLCASRPGEPEQYCAQYTIRPGITLTVGDWYAPAPIVGTGDGTWQTLYFYGVDSVGNRSPIPLTRTLQVDVVAPAITVTTALPGVIQATWNQVLTGTIRDGYGVQSIQIHVSKPDGNVTWVTPTLTLNGDTWTFIYDARFDVPGSYMLGILARDHAGNAREAGPFDLTVYESTAVANLSLAQSVSSDPAITGRPLTYTFVISNAGPGVATTATLAITLPTQVNLIAAPPGCVEAAGALQCNLGDLNANSLTMINVQVDVPLTTTGVLVNTAYVESGKVDLDVLNNEPEPLYTFVVQPVTGLTLVTSAPTILGENTVLTATTATGTNVALTWSLGDGATATGPTATHVYTAVNVYTAIVTATNMVNTLTATARITTDIPVAWPMLDEGFEGPFPPSGWLRTGRVEDEWWRRDGARSRGGQYCAFYDDLFGLQDGWLVTPRVTPTLVSELVFWQYERYSPQYGKHSLWVSRGSNDPKDGSFLEFRELGPGLEDTWQQVRVALRDYANRPIYLAFRYEGDFSDEWCIDDVQVTSGLVLSHDGPTSLGRATTMTATLPTGSNAIYQWDLGDGQTATGLVVTHTYAAPGDYTVVVTASNSVSLITDAMIVPVRSVTYLPLVMRNYTPPCPDAYEPDDASVQAHVIATDGTAQRHTFHQANDADWITFQVTDTNTVYIVETFDLSGADTVIYLYDSDGVRLLDWNDDAAPGSSASRLTFHPYHIGTFYVRIVNYDPSVSGCGIGYSVRVAAQP